MRALEAVHVVVPAHDEEALLPACLDSIARAVARVQQEDESLRVAVSVVLDSCGDRSAAVVGEHAARSGRARIDAVTIEARSVGVARATGVERTPLLCPDVPPERIWVATTDADSVVPDTWLSGQVAVFRGGIDLVVGRVHPDDDEAGVHVLSRWWQLHGAPAEPPVHGANLGFSLAAYRRAGGFRPVALDEDVLFVRSAIEAGCAWSDDGPWVRTSSRLVGRAPGGFASYLGALADCADVAG